jgi:hypothetical protein
MTAIRSTLILSLALACLALLAGCRRPDAGERPAHKGTPPAAVVHRMHAPDGPTAAALTAVSATELAQAFAADPEAAERRFAGHGIAIHGKVTEIGADGSGVPVLTLKAGAGADPRFVVDDANGWDDASTLQAGSQAALVCKQVGLSDGLVTATACSLVAAPAQVAAGPAND